MKGIAMLIGIMLILEARTIALLALLQQYQISQEGEIIGMIGAIMGVLLLVCGTRKINEVKLGV